ncbi:MAG: HlyC/CorC family transporter [Oscillospiraceae bacterium]|jgi:CBS domain containing-hemolysin-like protein|nr:HlyC/CorC family transporter [Oscillospiraceae bacterium]
MDDGSRLPWLLAVCLVLCAAYLALTETSFASASRPKLKAMAESGNRKAQLALDILERFDKAITTILIGTNIVHLSAAAVVTLTVSKRWGLHAVTLSTVLTTIAVFFAGEMLPKSIAKKNPEKTAASCAGVLNGLMAVLSPLSSLLTAIGEHVSAAVKGEPELSVTEDELYDIIEDMTEEGALDEEQGDLISSALQFGDLTVESVLTPRVDILAVDVESEPTEILEAVKKCNHSRLPVYEGTVDHIIGILQIRRFIKAWLHQGDTVNISTLLDEPFFIHQSTKVDEVLPLMTKNRQSLAVVTDNYGGTLGLITVEDILEELVGEIWDEDDVVEESVTALGNNEYSVFADEHVSDTFEEIGFEDPEDNEELVDTVLGAWAYENFGAIPHEGDSFIYHNLKVTAEEMDHNRIVRLKLTILPKKEEGGAEE